MIICNRGGGLYSVEAYHFYHAGICPVAISVSGSRSDSTVCTYANGSRERGGFYTQLTIGQVYHKDEL